MQNQSSKSPSKNDPLWQSVLRGKGIDFSDPGHRLPWQSWQDISSCEQIDPAAERPVHVAENRAQQSYDFLYSRYLLQTTVMPAIVLTRCWSLVRPGGYLALIVPDEDLYEQGKWPSRFKPDHRWTMTIHKRQGERQSWSSNSINLFQLITENLIDCRPLLLRVRDAGYDYSIRGLDQTLPPGSAEAEIECILQKLPSL